MIDDRCNNGADVVGLCQFKAAKSCRVEIRCAFKVTRYGCALARPIRVEFSMFRAYCQQFQDGSRTASKSFFLTCEDEPY